MGYNTNRVRAPNLPHLNLVFQPDDFNKIKIVFYLRKQINIALEKKKKRKDLGRKKRRVLLKAESETTVYV